MAHAGQAVRLVVGDGNRPVPSSEVIVRLAEALPVPPEHFREIRLRIVANGSPPETIDRLYKQFARS